MKNRSRHLRPYLTHAARVAAISTLLIASVYVMVSVVFDLVDSHHLVAEVDSHLRDRLQDVAARGDLTRAPAEADDDHDVDVAPVLLWHVDGGGHVVALSDAAPPLPRNAWSRDGHPVTSSIGTISFRVIAIRSTGGWLVAAESLTDTAHVRKVLITDEAIAGPVVILAMFFGALIIGLNASRPVEQARRRQLEFTADASHELRTPLSVIEAEVTLTLSAPRDADRYRDTVERVNGESKRLRRIIDDLLWLARFDSEPAPPRDELVDVFAVAQGCADRFGALARSRGIALSVEHLGDADPLITAPPEWIDRLAGVLVDNACRYAGEGGTVRVSVLAYGNRTTVIVEDSGPGIPPEERPLLFDRFHRATDDGSGTGLGLAIADSIVRSTGGRWRVTEGSLGGAHFEVSWHRAHLRDTRPDVLAGRPDRPGGDGDHGKVLSDRSLGGDSTP
jgi:signal transduction histidine kinase